MGQWPGIGLRGRFLAASLLLSGALLGSFALAVLHFLDIVESEYIGGQFRVEFARIVSAYRTPGADPAPRYAGFHVYPVATGDTASLPALLRHLSPGVRDEVRVGAHEFTLGRADLDARSIYVAYDQTNDPIELMERRLIRVAWVTGAVAALFGSLLALWLSRAALAPARALAARVVAMTPGQGPPPALADTEGHEIATIARAFDQTIARFDAFAERERAFTRDASHELRTPLAVITSSLQLIAGDAALSVPQRARIERARVAALQMQDLVEGLMFLARDEVVASGEPSYSVGDTVREAARLFGAAAIGVGPAIAVDVKRDMALEVPRGLLLCVINNLLRNALQHSGSRQIEIGLDAPRLTIRDHGKGLDAAARARLFAAPRARGGAGVGLDQVQRICARLGWRLEWDSAPGAGARFELHLG